MGNTPTSFEAIPENDYTPTAALLKLINVNYVLFGFQDIIENKDLLEMVYHRHVYVKDGYTEQTRHNLINTIARNISGTASAFITALIVKGITVIIVTHPSNYNGVQFHDPETKQSGYIFEGEPLARPMLEAHFPKIIADYIQTVEADDMLTATHTIQKYTKAKAQQLLVIHHNPQLIAQLRKESYLAALVDDHKIGFRLS